MFFSIYCFFVSCHVPASDLDCFAVSNVIENEFVQITSWERDMTQKNSKVRKRNVISKTLKKMKVLKIIRERSK